MSSLDRLRQQMASEGVGMMLASSMMNLRWLTGFTGSSGMAFVSGSDAVFVTDSRYDVQAREQVTNMDVVIYSSPRSLLEVVVEELSKRGLSGELGFEPSVSYEAWQSWQEKFAGFTLKPAGNVFPPLRMIKTAEEIAKIEAACKLADACMAHVQRMIQPGVSEWDISLDVEFFFRRSGAELAFEVIAVSGPNSAKPHGRASERKLERGDFVTLDFGCNLEGYNSDITRTFIVGEASDRHAFIYSKVLEAQVAAIEAIKPGVSSKAVDAVARDILRDAELGDYFGHGLGHGLGLDVHDYGSLSPSRDMPIEVGQVWTVEPGVYIPGFGGVRIEDDIVVEPTGARILTHFPKQMLVL